MTVKFSARSETGQVRRNNEDNLYCNGIIMTSSPFMLNGIAELPCIFAVFDGMGGEDCGETASLTAAESLSRNSRSIIDTLPHENSAVNDFVREANTQLHSFMEKTTSEPARLWHLQY